jgi:hypothetical protein
MKCCLNAVRVTANSLVLTTIAGFKRHGSNRWLERMVAEPASQRGVLLALLEAIS